MAEKLEGTQEVERERTLQEIERKVRMLPPNQKTAIFWREQDWNGMAAAIADRLGWQVVTGEDFLEERVPDGKGFVLDASSGTDRDIVGADAGEEGSSAWSIQGRIRGWKQRPENDARGLVLLISKESLSLINVMLQDQFGKYWWGNGPFFEEQVYKVS